MPPTLKNYDGLIAATPARLIRPETVDELRTILKRSDQFPGPVRAMGSFHSLTPCACSPGTMVDMSGLTRIVNIDTQHQTLTAQAGLQLVAAAAAVRKHGLQLMLNVDIGNMTLGSAACCHSKDSMDASGLGQVSSHVTAIKWVTPSGELEEASEDTNPELLRLVRASHGLCGIVHEVTLRVKPLEAIRFDYHLVGVDVLTQDLISEFVASNESLLCWTIGRTVVVKTRNRADRPKRAWLAPVRRISWSHLGPLSARSITILPAGPLRRAAFAAGTLLNREVYHALSAIGGFSLYGPDKTIDYSRTFRAARYTFTFWAFPIGDWVKNLKSYLAFRKDHFTRYGFRCNLQLGSYFIRRDTSSLLSYWYDGDVISLDPIHVPIENDKIAWASYLEAFNEWSHQRGGVPLLNQSPHVKKTHVVDAYGERWKTFSDWVRKVDPDGRMLNPYFEELLWQPSDEAAPACA